MNTTVLIIMIICATIIAMIAIISDHLFEKKIQVSEQILYQKVLKIHRNYIAGLLGFAIVMLISARYGEDGSKIFSYLSFGSTITSLVLSILAIFVTVQSSSDMNKQFEKIDKVSTTMSATSEQIEVTLNDLKEAKQDLQKTSNNITMQINNIVEQIDDKLKERMKETETNISRNLENVMNENKSSENETYIKNNFEPPREFKEAFLKITSANGLLVLYACSLSKEKKLKFELSRLLQGNEAYSFGFLIALISSGLIEFTSDATNNNINCTNTIFLSEEIGEELKNRIEILGSNYQQQVNAICIFFGINKFQMQIDQDQYHDK